MPPDPFRSLADYELFLYSLAETHASVESTTLVLVRRGATLARVSGEVHFGSDLRLVVRERLVFDAHRVRLDAYGYEVWRGQEKLWWYDPQPHPNVPTLQSTHPHHKHIPPDIKHNRIPAPKMSFERPNLTELIREVEVLLRCAPSALLGRQSPGPFP